MEQEIKSATPRSANIIYIVIVALVFIALAVVFVFFPRSEYSELEKRELAKFPDTSMLKENPAGFTAAVSQWFSDSEPYRDLFMTTSMQLRDMMRLTVGNPEEAVSFKPAALEEAGSASESAEVTEDPEGNPLADENAKVANAGIIIVGSGPKVRALMAFGGSEKAGTSYIGMINEYADQFPGVNVYALIAPLATEFYLPDKAAKVSKPQKPMIEYVRDHLSPKAKFINAYDALAAHTLEDIYLRTDHHWAPLGAFYAARQLARTAGVPFRELDSYDRHVIHNFVGSMYGYSKDIAVKNAPEDFVFYTPRGLNYTTTFVTYNTNNNYQVVSQTKPYTAEFFKKYRDGSGGAYSTFMGGDQHLVKVQTGTPGNRRVLIIKDSYGNAIPGYLFYSFNEVHVADFRYFKENLRDYVARNRITDIVIAFNVFNACSSSAAEKVKKFISQPAGQFSANTPVESKPAESRPSDNKPKAEPNRETTQQKHSEEQLQSEAPAQPVENSGDE